MPDYSDWIGRTETRRDILSASALDRLAATLDHRREKPYAAGDVAPPLSHWLLFLPQERQSDLGPDGHARRGGFLPPVHELPRRMWAGSRLAFPGDLRVGRDLERTSTIASVVAKTGSAGPLVFVTVRHEIREAGAGPVLITDEHDIVYRGIGEARPPAAKPETTPAADWSRSLTPDDVLLFRYSALTFNGHRIHYDRAYVTGIEGYPGLVVHGPLMATLLVDLVGRNAPSARIESFTFRGRSPVFDGETISVNGTEPDAQGKVGLWIARADGSVAMTGEAVVKT